MGLWEAAGAGNINKYTSSKSRLMIWVLKKDPALKSTYTVCGGGEILPIPNLRLRGLAWGLELGFSVEFFMHRHWAVKLCGPGGAIENRNTVLNLET